MSSEIPNKHGFSEKMADASFVANNLCDKDTPYVIRISDLVRRKREFRDKTIDSFESESNLPDSEIAQEGFELSSEHALMCSVFNDIHLVIECNSLQNVLRKRISSGHENRGNFQKIIDDFVEPTKPDWLAAKINKKILEDTYEKYADGCKTDFFKKTKDKNISFWDILEHCDKKRKGNNISNSEFFLIASYYLNVPKVFKDPENLFDEFTLKTIQMFPSQDAETDISNYALCDHVKGETPDERRDILTKIRKTLFVIDDFSFQVTDAISDNFDPRHEIAKSLIEGKRIFGRESVCLRVIADDILSGLSLVKWLQAVKETYQETKNPFYKRLEKDMISFQKNGYVKNRLLFTSEFDELIPKVSNIDQDKSILEIQELFKNVSEYQKTLYKESLVIKEFDNNLSKNKAQIHSLLALDFKEKIIGGVIDLNEDDGRSYKGIWYFYSIIDKPIFYLDVFDQENISDSLKSKIFSFTKNMLSELKGEVEKIYLEKKIADEQKTSIKPFPVINKEKKSNFGLTENKSKRKNGHVSMSVSKQSSKETVGNTIKEGVLGYKLVFDKNIVNPDEKNPERLEKAIEKYNKTGSGIVKMLNGIYTKSGNKIITLRTGSFRALFETSDKDYAHLVAIVNRKDYEKLNGNCI